MQAQQLIHLGLLDPLDYRGAYSTFLAAYGREDIAEKAKMAALNRYIDAKTKNHGK